MSKRCKPPREGDRVCLVRTYPEEQPPVKGTVDWVGATTFSVDGDDGVRYIVPVQIVSTRWSLVNDE